MHWLQQETGNDLHGKTAQGGLVPSEVRTQALEIK